MSKDKGEVLLADHGSATLVLHAVLSDAVKTYPDCLGKVGLPDNVQAFRKTYPMVMPRFEAARLSSPERLNIARHMLQALRGYLVWQSPHGSIPLDEALAESPNSSELEMYAFNGEPGWQAGLTYAGKRWEGADLTALGDLLVQRGVITPSAGEALAWIADNALRHGQLNLQGRKIAVLGGGAEMAPTRLWLEAGADVLWLDTQPPPQDWRDMSALSGRLFWPAQNVDLLTNPQLAMSAMRTFAGDKPLDVGLYAYAPGRAREVRLTGIMNAIVNAFPAELLASVTMLVSPTTPTALSTKDQDDMRARKAASPAWEKLCARLGLLGRGGGCVVMGEAAATRTVVSIQGASYQAAQYLGKILMAECWSAFGQLDMEHPIPLRVSANTAAITRTRSLDHPVFAAAFGGAAAFGVETLTPRQSRRLNGLLAVHDWLRSEPPLVGQIRVHGGIHTLPYPLESALRIAAAIGFARAPRLIRGLLR